MSEHDHGHDHPHEPITADGEPPAAARARALEELLVEKGVLRREDVRRGIDWLVSRTPAAARVRALEELLVEKGVVEREDIRRGIDSLVSRTPADGARLVARAWADPDFKERLLADARTAAAAGSPSFPIGSCGWS